MVESWIWTELSWIVEIVIKHWQLLNQIETTFEPFENWNLLLSCYVFIIDEFYNIDTVM